MKVAQLKEYLETVDDEMDIMAAPIISMRTLKTLGTDQPEEMAVVSPFQMYNVVQAVQASDSRREKVYFVLGFDAHTVTNINDDEVESVH